MNQENKTPAMKTRVSELLGVDYPIIQGAMAWIANAHLAAAVSNAGGLGIIACGGAPLEWVRNEIELCRKLTDKPFGVNIMLMSPHAAELAALLAELKVPVITTGAGDPSAYIPAWKQAGCKVIPVIASCAHAKRMEKRGVDAVVAEGTESGGHIGELTTMALIPAVCESVSIPVIAAGGIADGRGLAAAFCLGAEGVQMGTRFLTAHECDIHQAYKDKVLAAKDSDTAVTGRMSGHPARQLKNDFVRKARAAEGGKGEDEEVKLAGSLRRAVEGDVKGGSLMAGQIACLVNDEKSAKDIVQDIMSELYTWSKLDALAMANQNAKRAWHNTAKQE